MSHITFQDVAVGCGLATVLIFYAVIVALAVEAFIDYFGRKF